jgi:hypothetical protein
MSQINLAAVDRENFLLKEGDFCGTPATLIIPNHIGCKWTQENKIFRSMIVATATGEVLSKGLNRFPNLGETPDVFPIPTSLDGANIQLKVDGSCLLCDWYNNQLSMRTRGTFSYQSLANSSDFEHVLDRYPYLEDFTKFLGNQTALFEITSPNQKIVIDYGSEPDITLIGIISKDDFRLWTQAELDRAAEVWKFPRPARFEYESLDDLVTHIKGVEGIEGVCIYTNGDQDIFKCKSEIYLHLHRLKSELSNPARVLDWYISVGMPDYESAKKLLGESFDFEVISRVDPDLQKCAETGEKARKTLEKIKEVVKIVRQLESRKEQALKIQQEVRPFMGVAFTLLDDKELEEKHWRIIIENL